MKLLCVVLILVIAGAGPVPTNKPGVCPSSFVGLIGPCEYLCASDNNCPADLKCCSHAHHGCSRSCVELTTG